ncbi:MAG: amidohydrolase family protein [Planctomycetota bacterium]|nr:amidohydrolase family protein [Planctomycetota bacterium]
MAQPPLKVDLHTHILPERWPDWTKKFGYDGFIHLDHHKPACARMMCGQRFFREIESNCWDPEVRMRESEAHGVHVQVLSTVPVLFNYWAKPADALDSSRFLNDHIAGVVRDHPTRFIGLGTLPLQDPDLAILELERCVRDLHLAGVEIGTHVNGANLNDAGIVAVLEAAASLGAAVFVHPWDMLGRDRMQQYWTPWLVGMPAETSLAICSMIFGGVFERLPNLRVAFAHGGGAFPGSFGRIEHGYNVRQDLCACDNPHAPSEYLGRFWVDSLVHDEFMLHQLLRLFGDEKIALGSDYPFPLGELEPGALIESAADLSPDVRARLLGVNALDFLALDAKNFTARAASAARAR